MPIFYGKYRGRVTSVQDPLNMWRIRAEVPDVTGEGEETGWALPCMPFGGKGMGFFALPAVGAGVWIEFEQGDLDYPIWSGCWWGAKSELPEEVQAEPEKKVLIKTGGGHSVLLDDSGTKKITVQTAGGQKIILDDSGGGQVTISTAGGQKVTMQSTTVKIENGAAATVELSGPKVSLNNSALEVT
jgi:uncharacterized protein involved in type VI secretion and phage assembly